MNFKPESQAPCNNQDLIADPFLPQDASSDNLLGQVLAGKWQLQNIITKTPWYL